MKLNENDALLTSKVLLVPYCEHHVPAYHEWMQDEDLQKATASEPLTMEEEYAMQKSWRLDSDKLTFIVCDAPKNSAESEQNATADAFKPTPGKEDAADAMIGDVNLFIYTDDEENPEDVDWRLTDERTKDIITKEGLQGVVGEIEIMIARKDYQGKGYGREILLAFTWYIVTCFTPILEEYHHSANGNGKARSYLKYLRVKIDKDNTRSIKLFESVGFKKVAEESNYFGELELRWPINPESLGHVEEKISGVPLKVEYKV